MNFKKKFYFKQSFNFNDKSTLVIDNHLMKLETPTKRMVPKSIPNLMFEVKTWIECIKTDLFFICHSYISCGSGFPHLSTYQFVRFIHLTR